MRKAPRLSEFELEAFYQSSETVSGKPGFTENPMLDASENMEEDYKVNKSEYLKVVEANDKMNRIRLPTIKKNLMRYLLFSVEEPRHLKTIIK